MNGRKTKRNPESDNINKEFEGKIPPSVEDIEFQVLGAILIDNDILNDILPLLRNEYFYRYAHRVIFEAMTQLSNRNEPIDAATLKEELQRMDKLKDAGGVEYIIDLISNISSSANAVQHARIILEKYLLRKLISVSGNIITKCFDKTSNPFNLLDEAEREILDVSDMLAKKKPVSVENEIENFIKTLQERRQNRDTISGVPTGFFKLDELTSGFQKSELIIIAGRPSHGKTALALNIARNAAVKYKKNIAFFSLEMANRELFVRLLSAEAMVNGQRLKNGRVSNEEWARVAKTYPNLKTNIFIDDSSELTILELRAKARRMKQEFKIDMIIVDYLQLLHAQGNFERRDLEVAYVSRSLKALAKELDIPVVACAQLNRGIEQRGKERKPLLSDLRESGAIEQDADVVMFIHRPVLTVKADKDNPEYIENLLKAELIVGKQRNGPIGDVELIFKNEYAKFENKIEHPVIELPSTYDEEGTPF